MYITANHLVIILCIIIIFLVFLNGCFSKIEHYNDTLYDVHLQYEDDFLNNSLHKQTFEVTTEQGAEDPYKNCKNIFDCKDKNSFNNNGLLNASNVNNANVSNNNIDFEEPPSNIKTTCNCPPQISLADALGYDPYTDEEERLENLLEEKAGKLNSINSEIRESTQLYQQNIADQMISFQNLQATGSALQNAINDQAIAGNLPDSMVDGLNMAVNPLRDEVSNLRNEVNKMKQSVDSSNKRIRRIRFAL
jgi:hypothetical protein